MIQNRFTSAVKLLTYSDIFGTVLSEDEMRYLLSEIPLYKGIEWIMSLLSQWLIPEINVEKYNRIFFQKIIEVDEQTRIQFINGFNKLSPTDYCLLEKYSLLLLCDKLLGCTQNHSGGMLTPASKGNILKAYLACCDLSVKEATEDRFVSANSLSDYLSFSVPIESKKKDVSYPRMIGVDAIKGDFLLLFLNSSKYSTKLNQYFKSLGINSYREYLKIITSYCIHANIKKEIIGISTPTINKFLDYFCVNTNDYVSSDDLRGLRAKPLIKINSDTYIVINTDFFADKLYSGFIFDFANFLISEGDCRSYEDFKKELGEIFSEHKLFYEIAVSCFNKYSNTLFTGADLKEKLTSVLPKKISPSEPDLYIRRGNRIFLFEFKDNSFSLNFRFSGDPNTIYAHLKELFLYRDDKSKRKYKGVGQLAKTIKERLPIIISNFDKQAPSKLYVFPILVLNDPTFDIPGFNIFLSQHFENLINELRIDSNYIVKPVAVIGLNDLFEYEDLFQNGKFKLGIILNEFYSQKVYPTLSKFLIKRVFDKNNKKSFSKRVKNYLQGLIGS